MKLVKSQASRAAELFGLGKIEEAMLNEIPHRGSGTPMPPPDPLIYRFYEMVMLNGPAWKELIQEEFGDGIMSAIDFNIEFSREANPKGDRVKIGMSGKFLPYKYYGNQQGIPDYGFNSPLTKSDFQSPVVSTATRRIASSLPLERAIKPKATPASVRTTKMKALRASAACLGRT